MQSHYVETYAMENSTLDREVRFPTRKEAERALADLVGMRGPTDRHGRTPSVEESREPPSTTYVEWCAAGW